MLLSEADAQKAKSKLVASCDLFQKGEGDGPEGAAQWRASGAFCSEAWSESAKRDPTLDAGEEAMSLEETRKLMQACVDPRFVDVVVVVAVVAVVDVVVVVVAAVVVVLLLLVLLLRQVVQQDRVAATGFCELPRR
ncbi:unnamed protein product [Polarella glacialis]|uniref:Uncharacterized protein n=1 Tax=Polarella glacialis TaxID=89957 RepID=A0A813GE44_POLGL|nr:unnamed protein product [Polarella glacialis]CAE8711712.1 unnamed protein product [Polarella glacialis]